MNLPNFHDGHFDGLRIGPNKKVNLFLRTHDGSPFTLVLRGVDSMTLSELKQGNIIFDLIFRAGEQLTTSDMAELFDAEIEAPPTTCLLQAKRDNGLQLLELNSSYGAHGLVLFHSIEVLEEHGKDLGNK